MPFVKHQLLGEPPPQPHLGLLTDESGAVTAIPPGATMYLIIDPSQYDKVIPLVLVRVSQRALDFVCACANPKCNRRVKFVAKWEGWHPRSARPASSLREAADDALTAPLPKKG